MFWKWLKALAAITIVAVLTLFLATGPAYSEEPSAHGELSVVPGTVCAGEAVLISGSGAPPGETLIVTMDPNGIGRADGGTAGNGTYPYTLNLGTVVADTDGNWELQATMPLETLTIMSGLSPQDYVPGGWIVLAENSSDTFFAFSDLTVRDCSGNLLPAPAPVTGQPGAAAGYAATTLPSTGFSLLPALLAACGLCATAGLLHALKRQTRQ